MPTTARSIQCRGTIGADQPDCLRPASALAVVLDYLGAHEEAYGVHRDNVLHHRRVLGLDHPDTIASEYNLALSLHRLGRVDEAVALLRDVLSRSRKVSGPGHLVTELPTKALAALLNLREKSHEVAETDGPAPHPLLWHVDRVRGRRGT